MREITNLHCDQLSSNLSLKHTYRKNLQIKTKERKQCNGLNVDKKYITAITSSFKGRKTVKNELTCKIKAGNIQ